jgi:hypothetical protein
MNDVPSTHRTQPERQHERSPSPTTSGLSSSPRPVSLIELIKEKNPTTNAQRIAFFAYYREKHEDIQRFERDDLKPYFAKAKLPPPSNYDRDFVEGVKKGWIHEDSADSYLTSKGVEAVEASFPGERKHTKPAGGTSLKRAKGQNNRDRQKSQPRKTVGLKPSK